MIRTIIIDDEKLSRDIIKNYLKNDSEIEVLTECNDGFEGIKAINHHQPDLIFLDIQMPKISGFEMLELVEEMPVVIFSTAFDQYAIKAFELNATDYLLKPYSRDRFIEAMAKAKEKISSHLNPTEKIKELVAQRQEAEGAMERIVVKSGSKINIIPVEKIEYFEAQDDYVAIHIEGKRYLKQITMKYLENNLPKSTFTRVHRSYIASVEQINRLELYGKDSHIVLLKNGEQLPVSRSGYTKLKAVLNF